LLPNEEAVWHKYCRAYSKAFSEPLSQVLKMEPLIVLTTVFSDQLDEWDVEERHEELNDLVCSLQDPEYDSKKERAIRDELRKIQEEEDDRLANNLSVHPSLEKGKKATQDKSNKELPKSGGINMGLLNRLINSDNES
jgi:hypothetical protein